MFQNLLALQAVNLEHRETISVEGFYDVTDTLPTLEPSTTKAYRSGKLGQQSEIGALVDLEWPLCEEEFLIALEEKGWRVCLSISHYESSNILKTHQLEQIKACAKGDAEKTY